MEKKIYGFYDQELNVGDKIVFVAKSYGSAYMCEAIIHSIEIQKQKNRWSKELDAEELVVKVERLETNRSAYKRVGGYDDYYDRRNWIEVPLPDKHYIKRIYNWASAVTIK